MKINIKTTRLLAFGVTSLLYLASPLASADEHGHEHEKTEKADHKGHEDHDHAGENASPNGGRILSEIEPHAELLVTEDRKVQVTFLDEHGKKQAAAGQTISAICGKRSAPTRLKFTEEEGVLVSDLSLPAGLNIPIILQVKVTPEAKAQTIRLALNLEDCPTCDFLEYACTCDHGAEGEGHEGHGDHKGHDAHEGHDH